MQQRRREDKRGAIIRTVALVAELGKPQLAPAEFFDIQVHRHCKPAVGGGLDIVTMAVQLAPALAFIAADAHAFPSSNVIMKRLGDFRKQPVLQARASGAQVGPLQGIPISIKDLYAAEGLPCFAGSSRRLPADPWEKDGPIVATIRRQLGPIVGKTHMVEFAFVNTPKS